MITVKCIEKFRSNSGQIIGYRLQDINGQTQDATSKNLKNAIKNGQIHVINLKLTSDNRIVDTTEKQLQSKALGKPIKQGQNDSYKACGIAMAYLTKSTLGMGDSLEDLVDNIAYSVNMNLDTCDMSYEQLEKALVTVYIKMAKEYPEQITENVDYFFEAGYDETFEEDIKYSSEKDAKQSKIYKSLSEVLIYLKMKNGSLDTITKLENLLNKIGNINKTTLDIAYNVGHHYYSYLDEKLFGTISNDCGTVGIKITQYMIDTFKHLELDEYEYMCKKSINKAGKYHPAFDIVMLFKPSGNDVRVDFKFARMGYVSESVVYTVRHFMNFASILLSPTESCEEMCKKVARVCNKIVPKMYEMVKENPELGRLERTKE